MSHSLPRHYTWKRKINGEKGHGFHRDSKVTGARENKVGLEMVSNLSYCNAEKRELFYLDSSRKLGRVKTEGPWSPGHKVIDDIESCWASVGRAGGIINQYVERISPTPAHRTNPAGKDWQPRGRGAGFRALWAVVTKNLTKVVAWECEDILRKESRGHFSVLCFPYSFS